MPTRPRINKYLLDDVVAMLRNRKQEYNRPEDDEQFAKDLIIVVRERTLDEIASAVRQKRHKI